MKAIVRKELIDSPFPLPKGMVIFELENGGGFITQEPCGFEHNDVIAVNFDEEGNWEATLIER